MIKLNDISIAFSGKRILDHVSLDIDSGFYIITGESGAGKTTLLNLIAGYLTPDGGEIVLPNECSVEYLFQDDMLFENLTVKENMEIKYFAKDRGEKEFRETAFRCLERFGVENLYDRKAEMLSGGEKQRVQLAGIFMADPDIILLDEPVSRVDAKNAKRVINGIFSVFTDKTVIMVNHAGIDTSGIPVCVLLRCRAYHRENGPAS